MQRRPVDELDGVGIPQVPKKKQVISGLYVGNLHCGIYPLWFQALQCLLNIANVALIGATILL